MISPIVFFKAGSVRLRFLAEWLHSAALFIDALFITLTRKGSVGDRGSEVVSAQKTPDPRVPL